MPPSSPLNNSDEFDQWFGSQQPNGTGYVEVSNGGSGYPLVTFSFRGAAAVVHCFPSSDEVLLLVGDDGAVDDDRSLDLPIMESDCTFDGTFISGVDRARRAVRDVLRGHDLESVGRWELM